MTFYPLNFRYMKTLVLLVVVHNASATPLPKETKVDFVKSFAKSCLVKQHQNPLSKYMAESQLNEYCDCSANRATDFITLEDLGLFMKTKNMEPMRPHLEAAGEYCTQVLMKKWGYTK